MRDRNKHLLAMRSWNKKNRRYHRNWMKQWRRNEENRSHEKVLFELRAGVREGTIGFDTYMSEVRHPWKVKLARKA